MHAIRGVVRSRKLGPHVLGIALLGLVALLSPRPAVCQNAAITAVNVYKQTTGNPPALVVEVVGTNLLSPETPRVLVFPSEGATVTVFGTSATAIRMEVSAPQNYILSEVALSYSNGIASKGATKTTCSDSDVKRKFFYVPEGQVDKECGHGVGVFFDVIQISVVNECSLPVLIPLAGIYLPGEGTKPSIYPLSLDHITSIYSNDWQFSGPRAIYFNLVQAMATIGSSIEPFFGPGFTQGVSILGGGFTQASATIWKDLSAEQLQNLTSQSYQSTEQVGPNGGSLQKFIFLPRVKKSQDVKTRFTVTTTGNPVTLVMEIIPVITQTTTQTPTP
jgi:hypothetical protein